MTSLSSWTTFMFSDHALEAVEGGVMLLADFTAPQELIHAVLHVVSPSLGTGNAARILKCSFYGFSELGNTRANNIINGLGF